MDRKKNDNMDFWNFCSPVYDLFHSTEKGSYEQVTDNIVANIKEGDSVLELACGTGILSQSIAESCEVPFSYIATDFSPKMINACKQKTDAIQFEVADATCLRFDDKSFDHVVVANGLHIMPHPERALAEAHRVLKDNGGLLFAPNFLTPSTKTEEVATRLMRAVGYKAFNPFNLESYVTLLEKGGFDVVEHKVYTHLRSMLYVACRKE